MTSSWKCVHSFALVLGLVMLAPIFSAFAADPCLVSELREMLKKAHEQEDFVTDRNLTTYVFDFMKDFSEELAKLGPNDHIIDMGAGEALAFFQYLTINEARLSVFSNHFREKLLPIARKERADRARVTVLMANKARNQWTLEGKMRVLDEKLFQERTNQEIGKAKLIVDFFGVLAYSSDVDVVLTRYLQLLDEGGSVYIFGGSGGSRKDSLYVSAYTHLCKVRRKDGTTVSLMRWISEIPGLEVKELIKEDVMSWKTSFRIRKKPGETPRIPKLKMVEPQMPDGYPPIRNYVEVDE